MMTGMVNDMGHRGRVIVEIGVPSEHILVDVPPGYERLGVVSIGSGDPGVLARITSSGEYVQLNRGSTTPLDRRKVETAIRAESDAPRPVGRPRRSYELREVASISIEPSLLEYIRRIGDGSLSAGVTMLAIAHQDRKTSPPNEVRVDLSSGPRTITSSGDVLFWTRINDQPRQLSITDLAQQDHLGVQTRATSKDRLHALDEHKELLIEAIKEMSERDSDDDVLESTDFERVYTTRVLARLYFPPETEQFNLEGVSFNVVYNRRHRSVTISRGALQDAFGAHSQASNVRDLFEENKVAIHRAAAHMVTVHDGHFALSARDLTFGW